ncbi:MAG: hypothetical protein EBR38_01810 [Flavobacteriaceae bacterium]|nr:hypothetical protein [Flavobacteriaceae bacterium]
MEQDYSNYPTLKEANVALEKLKVAEWPVFKENISVDDYIESVQKIIFSEFKILPNLLTLIKPSKFPLGIFRVRELDSFTNINLFSEHSYPPINVTKFGRCNFPNYPVFYCSDNPLVALLEVVKDRDFVEKNYCISSWELIPGKEDLVFQNFLHTELDKENFFGELSKSEKEKLNEPFKGALSEDQKEGVLTLIKFLHDSFIKSDDYSISASLAHRTIFSKHQLSTDILMYPSIQTRFKGVNMAINPNFVNSSLRLKRLYIIDVDEIDLEKGKFKVNFKKYATSNRNGFNWKNINPENEDYKKLILKDFSSIMEDKSMINTFTKRDSEEFDKKTVT